MRTRNVAVIAVLAAGCAGASAVLLRGWAARPPRAGEVIIVTVVESGSAPQAIEDHLTRPIDNALAPITGVKHLRSESRRGSVVVACSFDPEVDPFTAAERVQTALRALLPQLPPDASPPVVAHAPDASPLWAIGDANLREVLERVPGVAEVELCGATDERVHVRVDGTRLAAMGLELDAVVRAVASQSPALATRSLPDAAELSRIIIGTMTAVPIRLSDVATVAVERKLTGCQATTLVEQAGVVARVSLRRDVDRLAVAKEVEKQARANGARWLDPANTVVVGLAHSADGADGADGAPPAEAALARRLSKEQGVTMLLVTRRESGDGELVVETSPGAADIIVIPIHEAIAGSEGLTYGGVRASPSGVPAHLRVTLKRPNVDDLGRLSSEVSTRAGNVKGVGWSISAGTQRPTPELEVEIDRGAAARLSVPEVEIAQGVRAVMGGIRIGSITISVGADRGGRAPPALVGLQVRRMPLTAFVRVIKSQPATSSILRIDRVPVIELRWETQPGLSKSAVEQALQALQVEVAIDAR